MKDLITKGDDGKYSLSEFGRAAVNVTDKVEAPNRSLRNGIRMNKVTGVILILIVAIASLSGFSYLLYNENNKLSSDNITLQGQIDILTMAYLNSPYHPPVSQLQAVVAALRYGGWTVDTLRGMKVSANLELHISSVARGGTDMIDVNQTVLDYSPKTVNGETSRYFWRVTVDTPIGGSIPPPGYYWVDVVTGDVVPYIGF